MTDLGQLADARRALEPERTIAALARAFELWRAPLSPWRERLAREHGVYSTQMIERGLGSALAGWTADTLAELRARELPEVFAAPRVTAVWLAGSIPPSAFSAIALPLLAGSAVYAKTPAADPVSARLFAESLRSVDPGVGAAVAIGADEKALEECDAVVAQGNDETIAAIRARVRPSRPFLGYGHKLSLAAIGPGIDPASAAQQLALDVALWDGRGCLSPAWALVSDSPRGRAAELAHSLAGALEELDETLPRGELSVAESADLLELRARAAVREGTRLELAAGASSWTVVLENTEVRPPPGTLRFISVVPFAELDGLARFCSSLAPQLSCVGHVGFGSGLARLGAIAVEAGASRLCPLGRMQLPPLDWNHDGQGPLRPLVRRLDVEG
ncbi:MAG: acyl-CoA reductase [Myxococcota bacterium]